VVHFLQLGSRFQVPIHLFHVLEREEQMGTDFMWYEQWEQQNSGIATPRPQACAQLKFAYALVKLFGKHGQAVLHYMEYSIMRVNECRGYKQG